jgi:hypothetical protein
MMFGNDINRNIAMNKYKDYGHHQNRNFYRGSK